MVVESMPTALHYFDIATQQPDTTNVDSATAATLFRIYGQMATIYEQQDMYHEDIERLWENRHKRLAK